MRYLKEFGNFLIYEKLGVLEELENVADIILKNLKNKDYFKYQGKYLDKDLIIHTFLNSPSNKNSDATFEVDDFEKNEFTIVISELNKSYLIHELKHMDRALRRGFKNDVYSKLNKLIFFVSKKYGSLFNDEHSPKLLMLCFYYFEPDEFEAHYNHIYQNIKERITSEMNRQEKKEIIDLILNEETIFNFYKHYYHNKFDILYFFKSIKHCNIFIKEIFNQDYIKTSRIEKLFIWFKLNILSKFKEDEVIDKNVKNINLLINKQVQENYRKFFRLYSIFI